MELSQKSGTFERQISLDDERDWATEPAGFDRRLGTSQDELDMQRLGQRQQLNRHFDSIAVFGLTAVLMATWTGIFSDLSFLIINGGKAGGFWGYIVCASLTFTVVSSLAEMASMAPTAGGQYHWVSEFAPPSLQKPLSYASGWLCALGWQSAIALATNFVAGMIIILAAMGNPNYVPTTWQITLVSLAVTFFAFFFNVWGAKRLPSFEGLILFVYVLAIFGVLVPLWVLAPKSSAKDVFTSFDNFAGWPTVGSAVVIGQIGSATAFLGVDSAAHLSEEVKDASITVPRMMMATIVLNVLMGLASLLTMLFVIQDPVSQVVESTAPFPFIAIFAAGVGSTKGAIAMTCPLILLATGLAINATAAGSRQAWAFARDNGLPFSSFFTKITTINSTPQPVNAMLFSLSIAIICALLNLGGSEVFGSIAGVLDGAVGGTYALSIACVLWRRLFGEPLPPARWSLGKLGVPINIIALLYQVAVTVICFFPVMPKPKAKEMNWGIAMFGGVAIICVVNYAVQGRRIYQGPVTRIRKDL